MPFFVPPSLPLGGDVIYGWSLRSNEWVVKNLCYCVQLQDVVWEEASYLDLEKTLMIQFDLQESFELP